MYKNEHFVRTLFEIWARTRLVPRNTKTKTGSGTKYKRISVYRHFAWDKSTFQQVDLPEVWESCRDWISSSNGLLYMPYYCTSRQPLSIMSFVSDISDDTVSFDEIAVLFKYLSPKVGFLCHRYNNQAVISYQYNKSVGAQRIWQ